MDPPQCGHHLLQRPRIEPGRNFDAKIRGQCDSKRRRHRAEAGSPRDRRGGNLNQGNRGCGFGGELSAPVDELMKRQFIPPAVFGLAQPTGLPVGDASLPVLAFLLEYLLTRVLSSCGVAPPAMVKMIS